MPSLIKAKNEHCFAAGGVWMRLGNVKPSPSSMESQPYGPVCPAINPALFD
jgi:hypothetical protein